MKETYTIAFFQKCRTAVWTFFRYRGVAVLLLGFLEPLAASSPALRGSTV